MFTKEEFAVIRRSLDLAMQSAVRLSNRQGQPANVVEAYLRSQDELAVITRKVQAEMDKLSKAK